MSWPNCCFGVVTFLVAALCACSAPTVRTASKKDKGRRWLVIIAALLTTFYFLLATFYFQALFQRIRGCVRVDIAQDVLHARQEVPHDLRPHERLRHVA